MNVTTAVTRLSAAVVAAGLALAFAGPAFAAGTPTPTGTPATSTGGRISQLRQKCETAITNRLTSIATTTGVVQANAHLTAGDRSSLLTQIGNEKTGLSALGDKIAGDTDLATLRADCRDIVSEYHWYVIGLPKVHLTIAADDSLAIVQTLNDLATRLQSDIDRAQQRGRNVTQAQADENALTAAIASGLGAASPVPAMVLPLAFDNWTAAQPVLESARTDIANARDDFENARTDAKKVIADLRALVPTPAVTATAH